MGNRAAQEENTYLGNFSFLKNSGINRASKEEYINLTNFNSQKNLVLLLFIWAFFRACSMNDRAAQEENRLPSNLEESRKNNYDKQ